MKIPSGAAVWGEGGVAGEGILVGVPKFHSCGKCTMPLTNIQSGWMSNASSHLCIIFRSFISHLAGVGVRSEMPLAKDLLNPNLEEEKQRHKMKRLVQSPNSFFMDIKCPGCNKITTAFSHPQTVILCISCSMILCQPTGGKARLTEGCSYRRKQ